jgi:uncharacterized membrane protein YfcA
LFEILIFFVALVSGATAAVVGFGIGSMLTPLMAASVGMSTAVAAVTIPHAIATALRCWRLRKSIDRDVLLRFGLLSAAGGLGGALAYSRLGSAALTRVLGGLLLLTAAAQLTGWAKHWRPRGWLVSALGLASGFFGGIAGNQGGLRSAALTSFRLSAASLVATGTAAGLMVDAARTPVYLWTSGSEVLALWRPLAIATAGVLAGTLLGERILFGLSPATFRRVLGGAVGVLGVWLLTR